MLNRVFESQDSSLRLGLVSDVRILLAHANHHALMAGAAHDGWEDGARSVIPSKTGLKEHYEIA